MPLQALLQEVDPAWFGTRDAAPDPALLARARDSRLGRRLLAGMLAAGPAPQLLAPSPAGLSAVPARWTRARLAALHRDLGTLAFAPAIRAEIGREPVRRLKAALGTGYLLALDRTVWDGKVAAEVQAHLVASLAAALATGGDPAPALDVALQRQGRAELQAWAGHREPALAEWARLLDPPCALPAAHLPDKPALIVYTHHQTRALAG